MTITAIPNQLGELFLSATSIDNKSVIGWFEKNQIKFLRRSQYKEIVKKTTLALQRNGFNHQDKAAILGATSKEWHFCDLGVLCAGGIVIPIYPSYLNHEILYIMQHSDCSFLFVENEKQLQKIIAIQKDLPLLKNVITFEYITDETLAKLDKKINITTYDKFLEDNQDTNDTDDNKFEALIKQIEPNDIASIIYTSGTTGEPKGAVITHMAFTTMLRNIHSSLRNVFTTEDRNLVFLPLSHVLGRCDSFLNLIFGLESIYAESIDKIIDNIKSSRPTIMIAVPRIFEKIYAKVVDQVSQGGNIKKSLFDWASACSKKYFDKIDNDRAPTLAEILQRELAYKIVFSKIYEKFGGRIRFFVSGGAPLSTDIMQFLRYANLSILEGYGLTETIAPCVLNPVYKQNIGTVGIPLGDVELKFASDGEILIKTKGMLREYYKNPEATKEAIKDGWLHSGDIGILTNEGYLKITDRKKDIIITSGGKNVAPQRIENILKVEKYIGQILIAGDKQKYLAAIISLDKSKFVDDLVGMGLNPSMSYEELSQSEVIKKHVEEAIARRNKELAQYETIKKFWIAPEEWTLENGALTPSLKLKKKVLFQRYAKQIDDLFRGE